MCCENCAYWFHDLGRSGKIRLFNASGKKVVEIYLIVLWTLVRSFVVVVVVVVVRHTQKFLPIVHAAAGARACPSNGIWRICDFDFWHEKSI